MSVWLESEHNWHFESMVFTVYNLFDVAHSRAICSKILKMLLTLKQYAHFQGKFTRIDAGSFGDDFWSISASSGELRDALGRFLIDLCFKVIYFV